MTLDYIALGLLVLIVVAVLHAAVSICDIPYRIAKKRNHPHQDAIRVGGWLSPFTLHAIWPFLWVWAVMRKPGAAPATAKPVRTEPVLRNTAPDETLEKLIRDMSDLRDRLAALELRAIREDA
ncbi:MAG: DUF3302 domain-containing protein [Pseudomonadota bacterium]|nr:MAG: DUF3302 domain-containing protein [Pseudomonadota bacterium]